MSDDTQYRAVCHGCGWISEGARYRNQPHERWKDAKLAANGHLSQPCDPEDIEIQEVHE